MIELREVIKKIINDIHPVVHYQEATPNSQPPYIVFDLPNSFTNEEQEIFNLDIDIWDNKNDTTALEVLANKLWKQLHNYEHIDSNMQFSIYRENRLPPFEDNKLKRRKLIFQLKYFDRGLYDG